MKMDSKLIFKDQYTQITMDLNVLRVVPIINNFFFHLLKFLCLIMCVCVYAWKEKKSNLILNK